MPVQIEGLDAFVAALRAAPWEREIAAAHKDAAEKVATEARSRGHALGGASSLTASAIATVSSFSEAKVMASAPFARGSEFGPGGGPNTRQFARIPGSNTEEGHWLGPALKSADMDVLRRMEKMVEAAARAAFPE